MMRNLTNINPSMIDQLPMHHDLNLNSSLAAYFLVSSTFLTFSLIVFHIQPSARPILT